MTTVDPRRRSSAPRGIEVMQERGRVEQLRARLRRQDGQFIDVMTLVRAVLRFVW